MPWSTQALSDWITEWKGEVRVLAAPSMNRRGCAWRLVRRHRPWGKRGGARELRGLLMLRGAGDLVVREQRERRDHEDRQTVEMVTRAR